LLDRNARLKRLVAVESFSGKLRDECLNATLETPNTTKTQKRAKTSLEWTAKALTRPAASSLRSIQKQPTRIQSYFQQKEVSYAA